MSSFQETGLNPEIIKAITDMGFETPTPIQEKVIPVLLERSGDLVGLAQTGTGKTAAFGLPIIQQVDVDNKNTQAIILSPTRELCLQITKDLKNFAKYSKGVNIVAIYGGASIETQIKQLKKGAHIIAATPGRLYDLIRRGKADISAVNIAVLDEADEMLNMGFLDDINAILATSPEERNTLLFSATMSKEIASIASNYMKEPMEIVIGKKNAGAENVRHIYYMANARDRYLALKRIADIFPSIYGIIFCRTRNETKEVADKLIKDGYNADALHGDLSQAQREQVMKKFKNRNLQMLVATDVAARGLDVSDLTHVINYNLPDDISIYTHRSGRTGRAGKAGMSIVIIHSREKGRLRSIEKSVNKKFEFKPIPSGREVCEKQLFHFIDKMEKVDTTEDIEEYLPQVNKKLEWLSKEDIIKRFVALEFNRFLDYYKDARDLNIPEPSRRKEGRGGGIKFARFFMNTGSKYKLTPTDLIGLINKRTRKRGIEIGKIEIEKKFTFFEVDEKYKSHVLDAFEGCIYNGRNIVVEEAQNEPRKRSGRNDRNRRNDRRRKGGKNDRNFKRF